MSLHHAAQHLASKGRNGDTTLVHMTKGEVAGLQALAKRHGTTLTKNPDTGLPEAFGLKQLLPMAGGAALMMIPGMQPMGAAAIMGGLQFARTGSLTQGLMAGMGAYGGAGLGQMAGVGAAPAGTQAMAGQVGEAAVAPEIANTATAYQPTSFSADPTNLATEVNAYSPTQTNYGAFGEAPGTVTEVPANQYGAFGEAPPTSATGSVSDAVQRDAASSYGARSVSQPTPSFMSNVAADPMKATQYGLAAASPLMVKDPNKYVPPEVKSDTDMGQRYAYDSGYSNDIPGRTGPASYVAVSDEEAKKLYGFAEGGDVQYPYGESVVRMADGGSASTSVGYEAGPFSGADFSGYGGPDVGNYSGYGGADVGNYSGYDAAPNAGRGISALPATARTSSVAAPSQGLRYDPVSKTYVGGSVGSIAGPDYLGGGQYGNTFSEIGDSITNPMGGTWTIVAAEGGLMDSYAQGGISTLGSYSDGGRLLKGPGDGMSDNIPAQIGAKQPARLADGEFVVPADVVSHLGNGSTDAGAKQLYKMMDKIRTARTGKKAQGKQINPNKFTPA